MLKVICINGVSLAGKDSFINNLERNIGIENIERMSTIDPIKEEYTRFFEWDGEKTPEHRKNLNTLKNIWRESCNGPLKYVKSLTNDAWINNKEYLFVMVREFSEMISIKEMSEEYGYRCFTLQVVRDLKDIPAVEQEFLDSHPKDFKYDITINNPTTGTYPFLPKLQGEVVRFLKITNYSSPMDIFNDQEPCR